MVQPRQVWIASFVQITSECAATPPQRADRELEATSRNEICVRSTALTHCDAVLLAASLTVAVSPTVDLETIRAGHGPEPRYARARALLDASTWKETLFCGGLPRKQKHLCRREL